MRDMESRRLADGGSLLDAVMAHGAYWPLAHWYDAARAHIEMLPSLREKARHVKLRISASSSGDALCGIDVAHCELAIGRWEDERLGRGEPATVAGLLERARRTGAEKPGEAGIGEQGGGAQ